MTPPLPFDYDGYEPFADDDPFLPLREPRIATQEARSLAPLVLVALCAVAAVAGLLAFVVGLLA